MTIRPTRRRCSILAVAALLAAGVAACQVAPETPETIRLMTVNDQPVTLAAALDTFLSSHEGHGALVRGEPAVRDLCSRIAERMLFLAEARSLGIDHDPEISVACDEHRRALASALFHKREVDQKVHVTDDEVSRFYDKTDVVLRVSLMRAKDRDTAERLRERVASGENFGDLARAESIDPSRSFGGLLPWVRRGELDPELETVAFQMTQPNTLTPVLQTANGFAFVRLEERQENANRPQREVALPQIRNVLESRMKETLEQDLRKRARELAQVKIEAAALTKEQLLADTDPDLVVARSAGRTLTMRQFREDLNLDVVRSRSAEEAAKAARALAEQWADPPAIEAAAVAAGLLEDQGIAKQAEVYQQDVVLARLFERYVYADAKPSESEVRGYYDTHMNEFTKPVELHLAHILLATADEAAAVLARLQAGEEFAALARSASIDRTSAMHSGKVGWVKKGDVLPEIEERAFAMPVGVVEGPIKTDAGYHLVKVLERKESFVLPYDVAHRTAEKRATRVAQERAHADWADRIKARALIEVDEPGIRRAVAYLERTAEHRPGELAEPPAAAGSLNNGAVVSAPSHP